MMMSYIEGQIIKVRSKFWDTAPVREVRYENGGIRVKDEWFSWDYFFQVNQLVTS